MEQNKLKQIAKNIFFLVVLDLILFPLAVGLYLFHGFHIVHAALGVAFIYGFFLVIETANLLYKHVRIVDDPHIELSTQEEEEEEEVSFCCERNKRGVTCACGLSYRERGDFDEDSEEPLKPEMKKAMDDVFGLKK